MFYKFSDEEDNETVDINWEYCTFLASLHQLESFMKLFLKELDEIEASRAKIYEAKIAEEKEEERIAPADINVMDLAATEINKNGKIDFSL